MTTLFLKIWHYIWHCRFLQSLLDILSNLKAFKILFSSNQQFQFQQTIEVAIKMSWVLLLLFQPACQSARIVSKYLQIQKLFYLKLTFVAIFFGIIYLTFDFKYVYRSKKKNVRPQNICKTIEIIFQLILLRL